MGLRRNTLEDIAQAILFQNINESTFEGWDFRKGKTMEDLKTAIRKGRNPKVSFLKVEFEISMVAHYLKDVLVEKRDRVKKKKDLQENISTNL